MIQENYNTSPGKNPDGTHQSQMVRVVAAYILLLIVLVITITLSYSILQSSIKAQRTIAQTNRTVTNIQISTIESGGILNDLKLALEKSNPNPRLLQLITRRAAESIENLNHHHSRLVGMTDDLQETDVADELAWMLDESPDTLANKLASYIAQTSIIAAADYSDTDNINPQIPLNAAGARYGTIFLGYQKASVQLEELLENKSQRIEQVHIILTALIIGVFLSISLLVVVPLWIKFVKEHEKLKHANANLYEIAYTDRETGLPNLDGLESRLSAPDSIVSAEPVHYLLLVRINNLDDLYNLIGSHKVEELLQSVSKRLIRWSQGSEQWCRSGEAEFSCIIQQKKYDHADDWVKELHLGLTSKLTVAGVIVRPKVSMAVSKITDSEPFAVNRLWEHQANARLASQSFEPPGCLLPEFNPDLKDNLQEQNDLINRIAEGIGEKQFVPFYQVKVDAKTGKPRSLEVLARWSRADGSIVPPGHFIAAAESSGLIVKMTYAIFDQIKDDIKKWCSQGISVGRVAINVAAEVLHDDELISQLRRLHKSLPRECKGIEVEITENIAIGKDIERTKSILDTIRDMGIQIAVDDFGTGYASLQTLIEMPIDVLKVDRSFVMQMKESGGGQEVVAAMISLSRKLNKKCVVEGVETNWQWRKLAALGADELQGYYFHKPASAIETSEFLSEKKERELVV